MTPHLHPVRRGAVLLCVLASLLAACSGGSSGPNVSKALDDLPSLSRSSATAAGIDASGSDRVWLSNGAEREVADVVSAKLRPDERTDTPGGDVFLLYRGGTVWITPAGNRAAVVYYGDNGRARSRHSAVLIGNSGWDRRMRDYGSGGGSSGSDGNGFRGGGSGSGK